MTSLKFQASFANQKNSQVSSSVYQVISKAAFENLNLIRALSGLIVVFSHFFQIFVMPVVGRTRFTNIAIASSEYAVLTFFILSGFLIALSINRNIESHGYFEWREYLISRAARIYPALIASVVLCLLLYGALVVLGISGAGSLNHYSDIFPATRSEFTLSWAEIFFTLLQTYAFGPGGYISVNGPLWSLSYEVGFYLAAGFLITLMRGRGYARIFSVVCLITFAIVSIKFGKYLFLHYGTIWMLGVALFFYFDRGWVWLSPAKWYAGAIVTFFVLTLTNILLALSSLDGEFVHNYLSAIIIIFILSFTGRTQQVVFRYLSKLADSTYTLYLFHFPLMIFCYALIRDGYDLSPASYFTVAGIFTLSTVITCHFVSMVLENRRLWTSAFNRAVLKLQRVFQS